MKSVVLDGPNPQKEMLSDDRYNTMMHSVKRSSYMNSRCNKIEEKPKTLGCVISIRNFHTKNTVSLVDQL